MLTYLLRILRSRNSGPTVSHVLLKAMDEGVSINGMILKRNPEIKEITALLPLKQRAEFRAKQFFQPVGTNFSGSTKPAAVHPVGWRHVPENREVLPCVDLDLQAKRHNGRQFRFKAIDEGHSAFGLASPWRAQPRIERFTQRRHHWTNSSRGDLHKIDVFRVPSELRKEQLMKRRAAAKGEFAAQ